jgi:hypothetical protein
LFIILQSEPIKKIFMLTHSDPSLKNKNQPNSDTVSKNQVNNNSVSKNKIQELANNSAQVKQLRNYQALANNKAPIQKKSNVTGLPDNLKSGIENLSGFSMNDVKVHYNSPKPAQLHAHAYAQGADIHIASGQERHLPHEAWHVVQQKQGRVRPTMQMKGKVNINDNVSLEKEADVMGGKAMQMKYDNNIHELTLQRKLGWELHPSALPTQLYAGQILKKGPAIDECPIQMVKVHRWMNADKESDYLSRLAIQNPEAYAKLYEEIQSMNLQQIFAKLDQHVQGLDRSSPFVSVARNPYSFGMSEDTDKGGANDILSGALHTVMFDIPEEYLLPGVTKLAKGETEILVLLPPGDSLLNYVVHDKSLKPMVAKNRWRGMSMKERQTDIQHINPVLTTLELSQGEDENTVDVNEVRVPAPWQKRKHQSASAMSAAAAAAAPKKLSLGSLPGSVQIKIIDTMKKNITALGKDYNTLASGSASDKAYLASLIQEFIDENESSIRSAAGL